MIDLDWISPSSTPFASVTVPIIVSSTSSASSIALTTTSSSSSMLRSSIESIDANVYGLYDGIHTMNGPYNDTCEPYKDGVCIDAYCPIDINLIQFWIGGIFLNVIGFIGIFGNVLSMVILSRPQMRSSINYLLIGLARCDTILIVTAMLLFGFRGIYPYTGNTFWYYNYVYPRIVMLFYPIATSAQTASIYLTLMVSLERYVAVCHPLRARAFCTYGRSKLYVIFCITFALIINLVKFWEINIREYDHPYVGVIYCVTMTELRRNPDYIKYYIHWAMLIINSIIPFTGLLIFNLLIYAQVRKANRERQRLSRTERREIGLATMLLCVVIVFVLFNSLGLYINFMEAFKNELDDTIILISNFLVTINSSVNFIIYVIFGEKFKRIFLLLFCKGRIGRESPDGLVHDDSSFSNGDGNRSSGRFSRHGTQRSSIRNGTSLKINRITRVRAPSPGPCVYYPGRDTNRATIEMCNNKNGYDWEIKNGNITSGLL